MKKKKITTALAALALLMGMGTTITSCTDEVENLDPARGNHTTGQLGIVSLTSDGKVLPARGGSPSAASTDTRATNDGGTSDVTVNRAIRSFEAGDVVTTRYRFVDITTTPTPDAYTCNATASAANNALLWTMDPKSATNPLKPNSNPSESWAEARMEITYAATGTAPQGSTLTAATAENNTSGMAYLTETTPAEPALASSSVRQYYDALAASTLSTATGSLPGKPTTEVPLAPGKLYIEPTDEATLGSVTANLAHRGALMRLTPDKITISGFVEGFDCLTDLLACATIKEGAAGSETETDVYVRFSSVTLTEGDVVWQAIVPAGAVVKQFIATIGMATIGEPTRARSTSTALSATYYIPLTNPTAAMAANTSYPLNLTLTPDVQTLVVGTAPALPGWPSEEEEEWVNTDAINVKDCNDAADLTQKLKDVYDAGKAEWKVIGKAGDTWSDGTTTIAANSEITDAIKGALNAATAPISLSLRTMVTIGDYAFYQCTKLTTIDLPVATTIGVGAFNSCKALATAHLPKATTIGNEAFRDCVALPNIDLPVAETIGGDAFRDCKALTNVSLPKAMTIGVQAFANCEALNDVSLLAATSIGNYAFYNCKVLPNIDLPAAETIGTNAFSTCTALTNVSLPKATTIGASAFYGCKVLTTIELPKATSIGSQAFSSAALTTISLPVAETIGDNAFDGCKALTTISLPAATNIGTTAFGGCTELTTLSFGSTIITWGEDVLYDVKTSNITLTLASGQTDFKKDGTSTPDVVVEFGTGESFAEYLFKEIK